MRAILVRNALIGLMLIIIAFLLSSLIHPTPLIAEMLVPVLIVLAGTTFFMVALQKIGNKGDAAFIRYFLVLTVLKIIVYIGISLFVLVAFPLEPKSFLLALLVSYLMYSGSALQWIMAERWIKKNRRDI